MPILIKGTSVEQLRQTANWIRDELEPKILEEGANSLNPDTVLELHELLNLLVTLNMSLDVLRTSRIHKALLLITGIKTPWPSKLVEISETVLSEWSTQFGKIADISAELYGPGGRLHGVAEAHEISRKALESRWLNDPRGLVSPLRAFEHGHLGFTPGQWWIHPCFAFHAGIISSPSPYGGITADSDGAYALTITSIDAIESHWPPGNFLYRVRRDDPGRFRLLNNILPVKTPIRILRSHTLQSIFSPLAGIRYEGLYKIMEWSACSINDKWEFNVLMKRDPDQVPMAQVLCHPLAEELDDYVEYRRIRDLQSKRQVTFQVKSDDRSRANEEKHALVAKGKVVREDLADPVQVQEHISAAESAHRNASDVSGPSPGTLAPAVNDSVLARRLAPSPSNSKVLLDDEDEDEYNTKEEYQEAKRMTERRVMNADQDIRMHKQKPGLRGRPQLAHKATEPGLLSAHVLPFHPENDAEQDGDTYFKADVWAL